MKKKTKIKKQKKTLKKYNARGERIYKNSINRENAKTEKINKNKMKKAKASVSAVLTLEAKIKKGILGMAIKKIDNMKEKSDDIDRMNLEFYGMVGKTQGPQTVFEQQRITKRIDAFRRDIGKRWEENMKKREEIYELLDMLYELVKIETENSDAERSDQISWAEVRKKIQEKMKKTLCR